MNQETDEFSIGAEIILRAINVALSDHKRDDSSLEQLEMLFRAGFLDELRVRTECGTDMVLVHDDEGQVYATSDRQILKRFAERGDTLVRVPGFGPVEIDELSPEDELELDFESELGTNAFHFLPAWCREAVWGAWIVRRDAGETSDEEGDDDDA